MVERLRFDYSKLKGRIVEICGTQKAFAELLGITEATMTSKLNGYSWFTQEEIIKSCAILRIGYSEISVYFFTLIVQ